MSTRASIFWIVWVYFWLAIALTTSALAQSLPSVKPIPVIPPVEYDHPYKGELVVQQIDDMHGQANQSHPHVGI